MNMKKLVGLTGLGLVVFGALLILVQIIWPTSIANAPEVGFMGATLKTTLPGLMVMFIGAILLVTSAFGRGSG